MLLMMMVVVMMMMMLFGCRDSADEHVDGHGDDELMRYQCCVLLNWQ